MASPRTIETSPRAWATRFDRVHIDLGTGDGRFAIRTARLAPGTGVIGLDTMLDHLHGARKRDPDNLRFVQADALGWPIGWLPKATTITINFPYGSLLRGLVEADSRLLARLDALFSPGGQLAIRVNRSALEASGLDPNGAYEQIRSALRTLPGTHVTSQDLSRADLRSFPSEWSRRLGYGRPTEAFLITARR